MITAIIETRDDEARLARTLAALVPAAAEGALRDVIVMDGGSTDSTLAVADAAGCLILKEAGRSPDARRRAGEAAKAEWLLLLDPGTVLPATWQAEARAFIDQARTAGGGSDAAAFRRGRLVSGWQNRILALFVRADARLVAKAAWLAAISPSPASSAASSASGARRDAA